MENCTLFRVIMNKYLILGNVRHVVQCIDICNKRHEEGIMKNKVGLYPCLGFNLKR